MKKITLITLAAFSTFLLNCSGGSGSGNPNITGLCVDSDGDGYTIEATAGDSNTTVQCSVVDDCNDADSAIFPDAIEIVGDGTDQNCDNSDEPDADDWDADGIPDSEDNCADVPNYYQINTDGDQDGDDCDAFPTDATEWDDTDGDGHGNNSDVCPTKGTDDGDDQTDTDSDGHGDVCDAFPSDATEYLDTDGDGYGDNSDVCPDVSDDQGDTDLDGEGNACGDADDVDGDGVTNEEDNCPYTFNPIADDATAQADSDGDGIGDMCDPDLSDSNSVAFYGDADGDGIANWDDNCPENSNVGQQDADNDGLPDACEDTYNGGGYNPATTDTDDDGVMDDTDNCINDDNADQANLDGDAYGDACDDDIDGDDEANSTDTDRDGDGLPNAVDLCDETVDEWYLVPSEWSGEDNNGLDDEASFTTTREGTDVTAGGSYDDLGENLSVCILMNLSSKCVYDVYSAITDVSSTDKAKAENYGDVFERNGSYHLIDEYENSHSPSNGLTVRSPDKMEFIGVFQHDNDGDGIGDNCDSGPNSAATVRSKTGGTSDRFDGSSGPLSH